MFTAHTLLKPRKTSGEGFELVTTDSLVRCLNRKRLAPMSPQRHLWVMGNHIPTLPPSLASLRSTKNTLWSATLLPQSCMHSHSGAQWITRVEWAHNLLKPRKTSGEGFELVTTDSLVRCLNRKRLAPMSPQRHLWVMGNHIPTYTRLKDI